MPWPLSICFWSLRFSLSDSISAKFNSSSVHLCLLFPLLQMLFSNCCLYSSFRSELISHLHGLLRISFDIWSFLSAPSNTLYIAVFVFLNALVRNLYLFFWYSILEFKLHGYQDLSVLFTLTFSTPRKLPDT